MLPTEILVHIFEYLDGKDIINLRKTCRLFADVVKLVKCPKTTVYYKSNEDIVYGFVNCVIHEYTPKIVNCKNVKCEFLVDDLCKYNGVNKITVVNKAYNKGLVTIPSIDVSESRFKNFSTNFTDLVNLSIMYNSSITKISNMPNLKSIYIRSDDSLLSVTNMPVLEKLKIKSTNCVTINNLPNLKHLRFDSPVDIDFNTLPNIKYLNVYNRFQLDSKHKFTNLTTLVMKNIQYELDMDYISSIKTLNKIDFSYSKITDVSKLTHIKDLCLLCTKVTDISMLTNLEKLNISYTDIEKLPPNNKIKRLIAICYKGKRLGYIKHIKHLDISCNKNIRHLPRKNSIEFLNANTSPLECIKSLKRVTNIHINRTKVSHIPKKNRIETIYLSITPITDITNLVNAKYVHAHGNSISHLPNFTRIEYLDVSKSKITEVPYCPTLTELHISFTRVNNVDHLTNLVTLYAESTNIKVIKSLKRLEFLYVTNVTTKRCLNPKK